MDMQLVISADPTHLPACPEGAMQPGATRSSFVRSVLRALSLYLEAR